MTSHALLFASPGPSHVLVVDDDPILHFALALALDLHDEDFVALDADDEAALLHRVGTLGFEYVLPFPSVRTLAERLRALVVQAPLVVFVADVSAVADRCIDAGIPVFGVAAPAPRTARLLVVDDARPSMVPELVAP